MLCQLYADQATVTVRPVRSCNAERFNLFSDILDHMVPQGSGVGATNIEVLS